MEATEPEHYRKLTMLKDGGDFAILKCHDCDEIFRSSPCGEENVEWDESEHGLRSVCPNKCNWPRNKVA